MNFKLPDITGGTDLIEHLAELGNCKQVGRESGWPVFVGLDHTDIRSYQKNMGFSLSPWEVKTLHRMSREYARIACTAFDPKSSAPYEIEDYQDRAKRIQDEIFK